VTTFESAGPWSSLRAGAQSTAANLTVNRGAGAAKMWPSFFRENTPKDLKQHFFDMKMALCQALGVLLLPLIRIISNDVDRQR
jgi:hypothetical protein